jgi:hypothetical protein
MASSAENRAVNLAGAVAAAGLALLSFAVARRQPSPRPATSPG